jgi:hypothetical protein
VERAEWWLALLLAAVGAVSHFSASMSDRDIVEMAYADTVEGLYKNLFDKLITNPPGDEADASANFSRGIKTARHAREIALKNMAADK